jgi:hypothetical protein
VKLLLFNITDYLYQCIAMLWLRQENKMLFHDVNIRIGMDCDVYWHICALIKMMHVPVFKLMK